MVSEALFFVKLMTAVSSLMVVIFATVVNGVTVYYCDQICLVTIITLVTVVYFCTVVTLVTEVTVVNVVWCVLPFLH